MLKDVLKNGMLGLAVADALGVPVEFRLRDSYTVTGMQGYGTHNQPAGTWSDDTSMALATLESMARLGKTDLDDIMRNFEKWLFEGEFTPYGDVFDCGNTCSAAVHNYKRGKSVTECGMGGEMDNGNGSLMRILPVSILDPQMTVPVSALTHVHKISGVACLIYTALVRHLMDGLDKATAYSEALRDFEETFRNPDLAAFRRLPDIMTLDRRKIKSSGYVVDSLEAALWCFLRGASYSECVLTAVNLGSDTDTVGAICGGLAGIYYGIGGEQGIPQAWIAQLAKAEAIVDCCDQATKAFPD